MNFLIWKLNRLRLMGVREILWRVYRVFQSIIESWGLGLAMHPPRAVISASHAWLAPLPKHIDQSLICTEADKILAGSFNVFALQGVQLGFPPQWNRDPKTGLSVPLLFGKRINYRDDRLTGDVKYLWEPNRHLELVTLAQAWSLSGKSVYLDGCKRLLLSWFEQCPYPLGINWTSSIEHAMRLANWSVAWHVLQGEENPLFEGDEGQKFRRQWLDSVYQHAHFISGHLSLYSSANNHLLGEYLGLYLAGINWPCWGDVSERWRKIGKSGLETLILAQNYADGVNKEQAFWYQHDVCDRLLLAALFGRANEDEFSTAYWQRLEAMLAFFLSIMDVGGHVPMVGDADDAVVVRFVPDETFDVYRSLLATGAVLFERSDFKFKAGFFDDKSTWLLGEKGKAIFDSMEASPPDTVLAFPQGGYYLLGEQFDSEDEVRIIADAGALGYLSIAAHGHADALSLTLSTKGWPLLIDPGTYAYHSTPQWRNYFRGTSAHNTIRVDGLDQSLSGGSFMWLTHASARCHDFSHQHGATTWVASHDGYTSLADPLVHQRTLRYHVENHCLEVEDFLQCQGQHHIELFWHFDQHWNISLLDDKVSAERAEEIILLTTDDECLDVKLYQGSEDPPLGWMSHQFDKREMCTTVCMSKHIHGNTVMITRVHLSI